MKYRTMGKLGIRSSAFGLGCMRFNGEASGDSTIDEQKAISLIRKAIDGGVTYIDTAYVYLGKTSEIVLGKALLDGYRDRMPLIGRMVRYIQDGQEKSARVTGVKEDGGLMVEADGKEAVLRSGEISLGSQSFLGLE